MLKDPQALLPRQVLRYAVLAVILAVVYLLRRQLLAIFTPVLIAATVAYVLDPLANQLERRLRNRTAAVALLFLLLFGLLAALLAGFIPLFIEQMDNLVQRIPLLIQRGQGLLAGLYRLADRLNLPPTAYSALEKSLRGAEGRLLGLLIRIPEATFNMAKGLFTFTLVLVLSFYLLRDFDQVKSGLLFVVPRRCRTRVGKIIREIDSSLGKWVRGQLIIAAIVGMLTYLGLLILGVEFSLIWGIFAGLTETIPYFGPFLGAAPAVAMALLTSWPLTLKTILLFIIIQQVESSFIGPYILGKALGLHPLAVFLSLLAGGQFFGIWGLVLAVPVMVVSRIIISNLALPPVDRGNP